MKEISFIVAACSASLYATPPYPARRDTEHTFHLLARDRPISLLVIVSQSGPDTAL